MSTLTSPSSLKAPSRVSTLLAAPLAAVQFLTRIPVPSLAFDDRTLPRAVAWFPLVGTLLGALAAFAHGIFAPHLPRTVVALFVVALLVALTGALHEDALADCADAFGLARSRERTLAILHDSAIGSFGASALALALLARVALLSALPIQSIAPTLIAALTLSRWAVLPLTLLPAATPAGGRGSAIARQVSVGGLLFGTLATAAILGVTLRGGALIPATAAVAVVALTAFFYHRRLGGTTGDCFGATVMLVETAVLLCGVWHA